MNIKKLGKEMLYCIITTMFAVSASTSTNAQDFEFTNPETQKLRGFQQTSVQSVDTEEIKRRGQQAFERQMATQGYYTTRGIGDFFKPGKDKLIDLIDKVIPPAIKPYIPELPDLKLGKKPKLIEILTPGQKSFLQDGATVYNDLLRDSLADLEAMKAAIQRKDGKAATRILAKLAYKHNALARQLRAARTLGMQSVTISISGGGAYFIGADGTHGIAIDIDSVLDPETKFDASWYATVAVSGGAQVGASLSLNLGFTPSRHNAVNGLSYEGRLSGAFAAGVGVSIAYDPVNNKFLGGTLSAVTGAEVEASFAMGHTEVIKTFSIPPLFKPGEVNPNPEINPDPDVDPITRPGPRKSLGIYSTMIQVPQYSRNGERVDSVSAGSAAARAGLEAGDVIISANGNSISNGESLRQAIANSSAELQLQVVNVRNGQIVNVTVRF